MKITIYELLGMIKNSNKPKKIYYLGHYYTWNEIDEDYQKEDGLMLFGNSKINYILDTPVKIVDIEYLNNDLGNKLIKPFIEPQEHKIPSNIFLNQTDGNCYIDLYSYKQVPLEREKLSPEELSIINKINEILDYLKVIK